METFHSIDLNQQFNQGSYYCLDFQLLIGSATVKAQGYTFITISGDLCSLEFSELESNLTDTHLHLLCSQLEAVKESFSEEAVKKSFTEEAVKELFSKEAVKEAFVRQLSD